MVLFEVTAIWLLFLASFSSETPTQAQSENSSEQYDPVANTFTIMTNFTGDSFNRSWTDYSAGFQTPRGNFWYGLEKLHQLTNGAGYDYQLMIALAGDTISYASCHEFKVDSEQQDYRVHCQPLPGYVEVLVDKSTFSTYDRGSTKERAASLGFGWWFGKDQTKPLNAINMMLTKLQKRS